MSSEPEVPLGGDWEADYEAQNDAEYWWQQQDEDEGEE